jgi:hypothetical protein
VLDVEKMYAATLGDSRLRLGGISSDQLDLEGSVAGDGRAVSTSDTHQELKCCDERGESRVVSRSSRKRRKEDIPVVGTSGTGTNTVSSSDDVETSSFRVVVVKELVQGLDVKIV